MPDEDSIRSGRQQPQPTLRELTMVMFRRRRVFVCIFGVVFAAALLYAAAGSKYQANMKILVRRGRAEAPVSTGENAPLDLTRTAISEEELNSEVELLRDQAVLRKVVEECGVDGRDWLHFMHLREGRPQRVERAVRRLVNDIRIEPVKKTNLIAIHYAAPDPQTAAKVLQSLANLYLEKHITVHRPEGEMVFFEQQADESRRKFDESSQRLLRFTQSHSVVSAAQQRDLALQKLSEFVAAGRQTRIEIAEMQQKIAELEDQLPKLPERTTTQMRTADNPELLKALKASLLELQLKKTQLLTKFEPNHRLVQEVNEQIVQTQGVIAAESLDPVRDETTDNNPNYDWAKAELQRTQVQLRGLQARGSATALEEEAYRAQSARLGEDAIAQDDLVSTQKAAQENYLLYVKKREEARMNDALDRRGIVNVALAEQPIAPALPMWSVFSVLVIGFMGAGAAGTAAAFLADYLDPVFRDPDDVLACLDVPVLASLPGTRGRRLSA